MSVLVGLVYQKANGGQHAGPNGTRGDYCYQEFEDALQNLGKRNIILILMDKKISNSHEWVGESLVEVLFYPCISNLLAASRFELQNIW